MTPDPMTTTATFKASTSQLDHWQVAAAAQGYPTFSAFVRDAIAAKATETPKVLKARRDELDRMIAAQEVVEA